jgi:hypothetical protein
MEKSQSFLDSLVYANNVWKAQTASRNAFESHYCDIFFIFSNNAAKYNDILKWHYKYGITSRMMVEIRYRNFHLIFETLKPWGSFRVIVRRYWGLYSKVTSPDLNVEIFYCWIRLHSLKSEEKLICFDWSHVTNVKMTRGLPRGKNVTF